MTVQRKTARILLVVLGVVLLPLFAATATELESYGFGGFSIGSQWVDISDLTYLVDYLFAGGPTPNCGT